MSIGRYVLWVMFWALIVGIIFRLLAAMIPGTITSWWRTPAHNAEVAGSATLSRHLIGLAVDIAPVSPEAISAADSLFGWLPTASIVNEQDHLHIQLV